MNVDILICVYGDREWRDLAWSRAHPSALRQGADNVQVWYEQDDALADLRNRAARASRAEWLCFLDADDELHPDYITEMRRAERAARQAKAGPVLLVPQVSFIGTDGSRSTPVIPNYGRWPEMNECVIGTLVKREMFLEVGGFDSRWRIYEDYALWLACERAGASRWYTDAVYYAHVRENGRNVSATYRHVDYNEIRRQDEWAREAESGQPS